MSPFQPDSPTSRSSPSSSPSLHAPLLRSHSDNDEPFLPDDAPDSSFVHPPRHVVLPDPSQFPDPYPFRHPHHHFSSTPPGLSSGGSSSASNRSSAYTSSASGFASGDYGHVHVASPDDDGANVGVGITSDDVVQLFASHSNASLSSTASHSRVPIDQTRWSESYSISSRSRSSSVIQSNPSHEIIPPGLRDRASYDIGWQTVDERDETGISEDETDEEPSLDHSFADDDQDEEEQERTSAAVIAEEGRGLIVRGDNVSIVQLQVQPGTTHLLVGSSTTPNAMPSFLTSTIPAISATLLALDISANFLVALPPCLATCLHLEELNIASNPLRVIPVFLSHLSTLRVLIADATGISTLPDTLSELHKLHTVSVRRNKMNALPSWLCLLPSLQTLYVDGNPFQGPWKALVEPLLYKTPNPPAPSTSLPSADSMATTEEDITDNENASDPAMTDDIGLFQSPDDEVTITPDRASRGRSATEPVVFDDAPAPPSRRGLTRTRTTPSRASRNQSKEQSHDTSKRVASAGLPSVEDSGYFGDLEVRKMRSAGDLRKRFNPEVPSSAAVSSRRTLSRRPSSSSKVLDVIPDRPPMGKRYASFGAASNLAAISGTSTGNANGSRHALNSSVWDNISDAEVGVSNSPSPSRFSFQPKNSGQPSTKEARQDNTERDQTKTIRSRQDTKEKGSRWGFLKKMSLGKMRIDSPPSLSTRSPSQGRSPPISKPMTPTPPSEPMPGALRRSTPQLDVRFSTTGILDSMSSQMEKPSTDILKPPSTSTATNLLVPSSETPKAGKRRSFLPIDPPMNIPIPEPSTFVSGLIASNGVDDSDHAKTPSPSPSPVVDLAEQHRKEEDRAQESYSRVLRSVMAYLKDMNDLGSSQSPTVGMYGSSPQEHMTTTRPRRPTVGDAGRAVSEVSMALSGTTAVSSSSGHLRSMDSMIGLRSANSTQTLSFATTDSNGSEERKFKDDKSKRAMVVREIVETERTYVKGLQELVDIYVKPGAAPVNMLTSGSSKDTVVPASERKIVFSGIDALFSFHKENFLPALEAAAAPLMKKPGELNDADADGQLSLRVAKAVGSMFLKHAAFMKMYSTYINNFDSSVQRVKVWSSDRQTAGNTSPGSAISPSSSTPQLVGLGLTLAALAPGPASEASSSNGATTLTASQRKRIRGYLKRCRMNTRHSQLNLEGYLLLPVQRIPRYRLLLEELLSATPPSYEYTDDPLDRALAEISTLANNMNEGKRESESRRKLVQWQTRIRGKFPSPLVQPHRRLIMDGPLLLTRVVRKAMVSFETFNAQGDSSTVQVDCLAPELTPRPLIGVLCNDLLVLCRDPSDGQDAAGHVDLWAVLRMQTLPQPASIVHGNSLRLVDNKAILYFDCPSPSDTLTWFRAINLHIPASKT